MAQILKGKYVGDKIKEKMKSDIEILGKKNIFPKLAIIRLGENPDDISYEKSIIKNCDNMDIRWKVINLDESVTTEDLIATMDELNGNDEISGILLFRPLPKHIDEQKIRQAINVDKDVDCMHPLNLAKIFEGDFTGFKPCTAAAALYTLTQNDVDLEGKNVVVVNRSMVVGKPLAMMLLNENATVTICHSKTKDLKSICSNSDIVVTALGRAKFFTEDYFNEESIGIDVGMSLDGDGKLSGDIDYVNVVDKIKMITPVPGGVGGITTSILLSHVVLASKKQVS